MDLLLVSSLLLLGLHLLNGAETNNDSCAKVHQTTRLCLTIKSRIEHHSSRSPQLVSTSQLTCKSMAQELSIKVAYLAQTAGDTCPADDDERSSSLSCLRYGITRDLREQCQGRAACRPLIQLDEDRPHTCGSSNEHRLSLHIIYRCQESLNIAEVCDVDGRVYRQGSITLSVKPDTPDCSCEVTVPERAETVVSIKVISRSSDEICSDNADEMKMDGFKWNLSDLSNTDHILYCDYRDRRFTLKHERVQYPQCSYNLTMTSVPSEVLIIECRRPSSTTGSSTSAAKSSSSTNPSPPSTTPLAVPTSLIKRTGAIRGDTSIHPTMLVSTINIAPRNTKDTSGRITANFPSAEKTTVRSSPFKLLFTTLIIPRTASVPIQEKQSSRNIVIFGASISLGVGVILLMCGTCVAIVARRRKSCRPPSTLGTADLPLRHMPNVYQIPRRSTVRPHVSTTAAIVRPEPTGPPSLAGSDHPYADLNELTNHVTGPSQGSCNRGPSVFEDSEIPELCTGYQTIPALAGGKTCGEDTRDTNMVIGGIWENPYVDLPRPGVVGNQVISFAEDDRITQTGDSSDIGHIYLELIP